MSLSRSTGIASRPFPHLVAATFVYGAATLFSTSAQAAWVATQTQAMTPQNGTLIDALPSTTPMTILVSLKLPNQAAVETLIKNMHTPGNPAYGTKLAPGQFTALYAPSADQANSVASYLTQSGFTNVAVLPNRLLVKATGTAAVVQSAFNTPISRFQLNGKTVFANTQAAQVPDSIGGLVQSVLGLQNVARMQVPMAQQPGGTLGGVTGPLMAVPLLPNQFPIAYDAQFTPDGSNTTVAIFMSGDVSGVLTDLRTSEANNMEPMVPVQTIFTDPASTDTSGVDEWDLDSQSSSGIAGNFKQMIWYVASSLDDAPLEMAFSQWVTDDLAIAANASFAECEDAAQRSGYLAANDIILMQAVAQGQTLFTSSGDTGAACPIISTNGLPDVGQPFVNYAGSSPYAVAVGGTTLVVNSDFTYSSESTWLAGGGGTSVEELKPVWQDNFVSGTTFGLLATTYKGTPDVSMDASPDSGATLVVGGAAETVGGTSLASPLAMGSWARLESTYNNSLTFAAPILYGLEQLGLTAGDYSSNITGFHDITNGSNGLYFAKTGWDYTNGIGTFDICNTATVLGPAGGNNYCTSAASGTTTGTTTGGTTGTTTGGTTGTTTGGTTGTTTGGTTGSTTGSAVGSPVTTTTTDGRLSSGGAIGGGLLAALGGLAVFRRRKNSVQPD